MLELIRDEKRVHAHCLDLSMLGLVCRPAPMYVGLKDAFKSKRVVRCMPSTLHAGQHAQQGVGCTPSKALHDNTPMLSAWARDLAHAFRS